MGGWWQGELEAAGTHIFVYWTLRSLSLLSSGHRVGASGRRSHSGVDSPAVGRQ
jgi:hypothetical protein